MVMKGGLGCIYDKRSVLIELVCLCSMACENGNSVFSWGVEVDGRRGCNIPNHPLNTSGYI